MFLFHLYQVTGKNKKALDWQKSKLIFFPLNISLFQVRNRIVVAGMGASGDLQDQMSLHDTTGNTPELSPLNVLTVIEASPGQTTWLSTWRDISSDQFLSSHLVILRVIISRERSSECGHDLNKWSTRWENQKSIFIWKPVLAVICLLC